MAGILYDIFKILFFLTLPFVVLLKGATYVHVNYQWQAWFCILSSALATAFLLIFYFSFIYGSLTGRLGNLGSIKRRAILALIVVMGYAMHSAFFISSKNLSNQELRKEVVSLHPILRLAISTLVYLDRDLIITDGSRVPEDYKRMGLPTNKSSLHYIQSSGYAHAVDIRTTGRWNGANKLIELYFRMMGFNTLRHIGTADHLHVSLMSHDKPHGI